MALMLRPPLQATLAKDKCRNSERLLWQNRNGLPTRLGNCVRKHSGVQKHCRLDGGSVLFPMGVPALPIANAASATAEIAAPAKHPPPA